MSETTEKIRREFTPSTSPCGMTEKGCVHFHSRVLKLCDDHERLEDAASRPLSLDEWTTATRRMLAEVYPESTFMGVSGDPGPRAIVVIRKGLAEVDGILGEVRG